MRLLTALLLSLCCLIPAQAATPLSDADAEALARRFYEERGEWAGKFRIERMMRARRASDHAGQITVHYEYEWVFIQRPDQRGIDRRFFIFRHDGKRWQVSSMGPHQSGAL